MKSTGVFIVAVVVGWLADPIYGWIEIPTTIRSNLHRKGGKIALSPINIKDDYNIMHTLRGGSSSLERCEKDDCIVLYGAIRDCAYRIKRIVKDYMSP